MIFVNAGSTYFFAVEVSHRITHRISQSANRSYCLSQQHPYARPIAQVCISNIAPQSQKAEQRKEEIISTQ